MLTLVKDRVDLKSASTPKTNGLAVAALLLGIAVACALLSSAFPLPPDAPTVPDVVPTSDPNFFAP
jgi:hypothetical protein